MTPVVVASRVAHIANRAASGDPVAQEELGQCLPAVESFGAETCEVFVGTLDLGTIEYLRAEFDKAIENLNPFLSDLLIERGLV